MMRHWTCFRSWMVIVICAMSLPASWTAAQDAPPAGGSFLIGKTTYKVAHAVAYETKFFDDEVIAVLVSDRKIPVDKLQKALKEGEGSDERFFLFQPHVKFTFSKEGTARSFSAWADNTSLSTSGDDLKGSLKLEKGRVRGSVNLPVDGEGEFKRSVDLKFDLALLGSETQSPAKPAAKAAGPVKPSISGVFKGNGKEAKLAFVSAHWREPFNDEPSIKLVFTEKDHSQDPKPDFNASFGKYGSALVISLHENGNIFGCEVSHAAHEKRGFSSIGDIKTVDFTAEEGRIAGELTTDGEQEVFGETWEVKIKFTAPLAEMPKDARPASDDAPQTKRPKVAVKPLPLPDEPEPRPEPKPAGEQLNVKELAIPEGAKDFEYKTVVEHLAFKSKSDVKTLSASLTKSLAAQGWKNDGSDLVTPASAILKRKRGDASLTIFVKPSGGGSQVTMFTEGLSWEDK